MTSSMTEAAQVAGISRRTLYEYLKDSTFRKRLEKAFDTVIVEQANDLFTQRKEAERVLVELMREGSPEIRLKAAKAIIENASKREETLLAAFSRWKTEYDPFGFT